MRPSAAICRLVTRPASEVVTLTQVKAHLRVDGSDDDTLLTSLISLARERLEQETKRAWMRQQWQADIIGNFGSGLSVELPRPRILTGSGNAFLLQYRDTAGEWQTEASYMLQANREPARLWGPQTAPSDIDTPRDDQDAVWRATYWTGYGAEADDVPGPLKHAVLMLMGHLDQNRELTVSGRTITEVPKSLDWLLQPYRVAWEGAC